MFICLPETFLQTISNARHTTLFWTDAIKSKYLFCRPGFLGSCSSAKHWYLPDWFNRITPIKWQNNRIREKFIPIDTTYFCWFHLRFEIILFHFSRYRQDLFKYGFDTYNLKLLVEWNNYQRNEMKDIIDI